jgi:hypothetical protein
VSTTYCPSATDLELLTERARMTAADHTRQQARLQGLVTSFEKQRSKISPQAYACSMAEIAQQELIVDAAAAAMNTAEAERAVAWAEEDRRTAERAKQERLQTLDAALKAKTKEIDELQHQLGEIPDRLLRVRGEHMRLQAERAAL